MAGNDYMGLAAAYCEAAIASLAERRWHDALREAVIAFLYASIALVVLDPTFLPIQPPLIA
jgi:hypothetical protein